eukprot:TRINITY_DN12143_c3_g1_i1.p1 TRINITY_DN12143_c3_g1~~TRINITY_DN12143_c3_g1_i1.p1  ORF type:complete len:1021 (+),score=271.12 TRINITY_DN12143_c3_g1_i1:137-3199(+)
MGQSNSVPGSEFVPFAFWDVVYTSNKILDQAFTQASTGDYVIRRVLGDPTLFELLVCDDGSRLRYTFRHDQNEYHYGGQKFPTVDHLLASVMQAGLRGKSGVIHLQNCLATDFRRDLPHYMVLYSKPMWYAGKASRAEAKKLVKEGGKGAFLVRASEEDHSYSLIVADAKGDVSFFLIQENEDGSCQFGNHRFKTMSALAHKIGKSGLKGKGGKLHLTTPIAMETTEPYEMKTTAAQRPISPTDKMANADNSQARQPSASATPPAPSTTAAEAMPPASQQLNKDGVPRPPPPSNWFAGRFSRQQAAAVLLNLPDKAAGDFVFHQHVDTDTVYYLTVNDHNQAAQYKILVTDGQFLFGPRLFPSLPVLKDTALKTGLKGRQGQLALIRPCGEILRKRGPEHDAEGRRSTTEPSTKSELLEMAKRASVSAKNQTRPTAAGAVRQTDRARLPTAASAPRPGSRPMSQLINAGSEPVIVAGRTATEEVISDDNDDDDDEPIQGVSMLDEDLGSILEQLDITIMPLDVQGYKELPKREVDQSTLPKHGLGPRLNRFRDVLPNPLTRVKLPELQEDPSLEYINANWVRGYGGRQARAYVAAQAPKDTGLFNFWRMILHVQARTMVMVTGLIEGGKNKCQRYWPETVYNGNKGDEMVYGPPRELIHVRTLSIDRRDGYEVTHIKVTCNDKELELAHYWFLAWPDHGVPTKADASMETEQLINMLLDLRKYRKKLDGEESTCVVHCSAGIGRTGTVIVLDHAMRALEVGDNVDLLKIIAEVREDRMALVQHVVQYRYLYQATCDYHERLQEQIAKRRNQAQSSQPPGRHGSMMAVARPKEYARYEKSGDWELHAKDGDRKVYTLKSSLSLPQAEDDHEASFAPQEQVEAGEVVASQVESKPKAEGAVEDLVWYRSNYTRAQVEDLLTDAEAGTFIVRKSSKPGHYALSLQPGGDGRIANLLIIPIKTAQGIVYKLGVTGKETFKNIADLVKHYLEEGIPASEHTSEVIRLRQPTASGASVQLDEEEEA